MKKTSRQTFYMRRLDQMALTFSIATNLLMIAVVTMALTAFPQRAESAEIAAPASPPAQQQETQQQEENTPQQSGDEDDDAAADDDELAEIACILEAS